MLESFGVLGFEVELAFAFQCSLNKTLQYSDQTLEGLRFVFRFAHFPFLHVYNGGQRRSDRILVGGSGN